MSGSIRVRLESVHRDYRVAGNRVQAVAGVDLEFEAGSRVAIVGPSGCGKSTLLSLIGALELPTSGKVWFEGVQLSRRESERSELRRRRIGFVFQSYDLLPFLTARENVEFQVALSGERGGDAPRLLDRLGLAEHADKVPDQLSGGQRQRVGLARALANRPSLILADEPTGELDTAAAAQVMDLLLESQAELDATLIVVTHDLDVAARLDRTIGLRDGRVVSDSMRGVPASA
jgi:putative ABC transport system ATP-binding protein